MRQSLTRSLPSDFALRPPAAPRVWTRWPLRSDILIAALMAAAIWLWAVPLPTVDVRQMNDTGLISVLPPLVIVGLALLCASFSLTISRRPLPVWLVVVHLVLLNVMTYGLTSIVYGAPRFAIGWKLAGIMDYIMQTGTVDGRIDAFFNWPGFFILMAFLIEISGLRTPDFFMVWAPVIFNLLYLGPLWMIFRSATADLRLVLTGIWFFYLTNWIGQDYLAPQALNYLFYLTVLGILLTWLRGSAWPAKAVLSRLRAVRLPEAARYLWDQRLRHTWDRVALWWTTAYEQPAAPTTPVQRAALFGIIVVILAAMVSSHQLTPFATLGAITALVLFNRCTVVTLPLILGTMTVTWIVYGASHYLHGHIEHITEPVGTVTSNIDANLVARFRGSPGHLFINTYRTVMTLAVWTSALAGGIRRARSGYRDVALALLAGTPFPLLLLQAYGGELLLRIYLYSVPFMAFFCACLFFPSLLSGRRWVTTLMLWGFSVITLVAFLFTRYGNERMMYFSQEEVSAVHYLYSMAEPGSQLVAITGTLPWRFQEYRTYKYTTDQRVVRTGDIASLVNLMANRRVPASYLILTRSQQASGELYIGWPPGIWDQFVEALHASDEFTLLYANQDAEIFGLTKFCHQRPDGRYSCVMPPPGWR